VSVCLLEAGIVSKRLHRSRWFFACNAGFPRLLLRFKDIMVSLKISVCILHSIQFNRVVPNSGLRKFVHGTSSVDKRDINNDRRRSAVDNTRRHGGRGQVLSTSTDDRRLCVQRDGRLSVRQRRAVHRRLPVIPFVSTMSKNGNWPITSCRGTLFVIVELRQLRLKQLSSTHRMSCDVTGHVVYGL